MPKKTGPQRSKAGPGLGVSESRLCLDFVNTEGVVRNNPLDRLDSVELFAEWASRYGLGELSSLDETSDATFLARARGLREALYRIFAALTQGHEPARDDLAVLNLELAEAMSRLRLAWKGGAVRWSLVQEGRGLEEALWADHGEYLFKGLETPVHILEVGVEGAPMSPPPETDKARVTPRPTPPPG